MPPAPRPQTRGGSPLRERASRPPSSARGRGTCAWRGGRGAGEGAATIPGPITGVMAVVEVARVAALGRLRQRDAVSTDATVEAASRLRPGVQTR